MEPQPVLFALFLTTLAGLSTGIGSAIAFFAHHSHKGFLSVSLGFSGGVMIYIAFVELFINGGDLLGTAFGDPRGHWIATAAFFGGVALTVLIDALVPHRENPHDAVLIEEGRPDGGLARVGLVTALAIGIHNFPEGIATFMAGMSDPTVGIAIAVAVALHNIPEGISVSVPVYYATGNRRRAFWFSFASGLSEPVGALAAWLVLAPFLSDALLGVLFAAVAGIMVFISLDQLIPNAKKYGEGHEAVYGMVGGMAVMAVSLLLLG